MLRKWRNSVEVPVSRLRLSILPEYNLPFTGVIGVGSPAGAWWGDRQTVPNAVPGQCQDPIHRHSGWWQRGSATDEAKWPIGPQTTGWGIAAPSPPLSDAAGQLVDVVGGWARKMAGSGRVSGAMAHLSKCRRVARRRNAIADRLRDTRRVRETTGLLSGGRYSLDSRKSRNSFLGIKKKKTRISLTCLVASLCKGSFICERDVGLSVSAETCKPI